MIQRDCGNNAVIQGSTAVTFGGALAKKVISTVPKGEEMQGFYSRYFLVPKKTGGLRQILDLALFNKCIAERPVHMLTIRRVLVCETRRLVHLYRFE